MNNVFSKDSSAVPEYGLRLHTAVLWLRLLGFTARELSNLGKAPEPQAGDADALQKYRDQLDKRAYQLNAASVRLTREIQKVWVPDAKKAEADRLRVNAEQHPQSLWIGIGAG